MSWSIIFIRVSSWSFVENSLKGGVPGLCRWKYAGSLSIIARTESSGSSSRIFCAAGGNSTSRGFSGGEWGRGSVGS